MLDQPRLQNAGIGSSTITRIISFNDDNSFDEFCINLADKLFPSDVLHHIFEDSAGYNSATLSSDGIALPSIATMDNWACVEYTVECPLQGSAILFRR